MRARIRAARSVVPAPLAALLGAVLVLGVTWALVVPPLQGPDEQSHAGYVQSLAEGPGLPGHAGRPPLSTEQLAAQDAVNSDQTAGAKLVRPRWSTTAWDRWQRFDERLPATTRSDGGGDNAASSNPPLFYAYSAIPYAASGGDFFARLTAMRLASVLWLLVTVVGAWLLAGELFGRDRLLQLVTAAVCGLMPMVVFISVQIGPDTMLYALWSLVLWLGVRILRRGADTASAVALLGLTGLAIVTKATAYALVPAVLLVLGVGLWRLREARATAARAALAGLAALALPVLVWFAIARATDHPVAAQVSESATTSSGTSVRHLLSYVWQYYLPRLPSMDEVSFSGGYPAFQIWIKQGWAAFGWLEVRFPEPAYKAFAAITAAVGLAALAQLGRLRRRIDWPVATFLALTVAALLAGLHWTDFRNVTSGAGPFMQGRYVFPAMPLIGAAVALALTWLRGTARHVGAGAVLGGLVALQLLSLGLVTTRYFA